MITIDQLLHQSNDSSFSNTPAYSSPSSTSHEVGDHSWQLYQSLSSSSSSSQSDFPSNSLLSSFPSSSSAYSSASTPVVPLIASRISLPNELNIIPLHQVLPPALAVAYDTSLDHSSLLRSPHELFTLNLTSPLKPARIAGSRAEYVLLIGRLLQQGMISFTSQPLAVNGMFAVAKDDESDRLIIDAQPANRCFIDAPHVELPNPAHLTQLQVPHGETMYVAKTDLSNFYHHLGLPTWMQPYFALPALTAVELASIGAPSSTHVSFPMCRTLPMGFSHAVYLAQQAHQHVVYAARMSSTAPAALLSSDNLLQLSSPHVTHDRALHGIIIDDFFLFSLDRALAQRVFDRVLEAYAQAGFVVKRSKVVAPTSLPIKVIGFEINGASSTISLPLDSQASLIRATLSVLHSPTLSSGVLSHVLGRWTWVMMLCRPTLAVFQHVYRFVQVAKGKRFHVWPSVRRELRMILSLLPLLTASLDRHHFQRVLASDASSLAAGVVSTSLDDVQHDSLWMLCSSKHHGSLQPLAHSRLVADLPPPLQQLHALYSTHYERVMHSSWKVIVSSAWRDTSEHINVLELRAALLALHHAVSYPSSHSSRVYLLLDSTVAYFSLWKGRSSSPQLLLVLRKISALLLAGDLSLLLGWLPSAVNPADAPSRLLSTSLSHDE